MSAPSVTCMKPRNLLPLAMLAMLWIAGCASPMFTARELPPQYHAQRHINARHIDLSRLPRSATPSEWIQPGDSILVTIATGVEETPVPDWKVDVDVNGAADIPLVGRILVADLTPNAASTRIRDEAIRKGLYVSPNVSVRIDRRRTYQVAVVGAVNRPQSFDIPVANCDLLTALSLAEGLAIDAETTVEIRHTPAALQAYAQSPPRTPTEGDVSLASFQPPAPPPQIVRVDLARIESVRPQDLQLLDGSVVNVARRIKRNVNVMGLVNRPSTIEMPDGEDFTVLSAIAQAGGPTLSVADKVHIVRIPEGSLQPITIEASLRDARQGGPSNLLLAAGDTVTIVETPSTVVVDAVRTFFRVGITPVIPGL